MHPGTRKRRFYHRTTRGEPMFGIEVALPCEALNICIVETGIYSDVTR